MWWMGLVAAVLALAVAMRLRRRRAERARIDGIRTAVDCSLSAPKQPDDIAALDTPPTESCPLSPRSGVVRCSPRMVLSDPKTLSTILFPGWRFR